MSGKKQFDVKNTGSTPDVKTITTDIQAFDPK